MSLSMTEVGAKVVAAIAAACVLGGGTVVLNTQRENAVQDAKLEVLDRQQSNTLGKIDKLTDEVAETNNKIERLIGRLEARDDDK